MAEKEKGNAKAVEKVKKKKVRTGDPEIDRVLGVPDIDIPPERRTRGITIPGPRTGQQAAEAAAEGERGLRRSTRTRTQPVSLIAEMQVPRRPPSGPHGQASRTAEPEVT